MMSNNNNNLIVNKINRILIMIIWNYKCSNTEKINKFNNKCIQLIIILITIKPYTILILICNNIILYVFF